MKNKQVNSPFLVAIGLGGLLLLVGNVYIVKSLIVFGSPLLFAIGIAIELILLVIVAHSLIRLLHVPIKIAVSIIRSAWSGVATNEYVRRFRSSHRSISTWLVGRLSPKQPTGLYLTLGVITALVVFSGFINVLQNVVGHGSLTQIDVRIANLMPYIRTPLQTTFFRFVTFLDNGQSIVLLVALAGGILWRARQRLAAVSFIAALLIGEVGSYIPKHLVGRMRPDPALSLYKQGTFSFPSGHVIRSTILSGLLAYLLFRSFRSTLSRYLIIGGYVISVALVALSRVYLGVHYPSDVIASVFLGGSILVLFITGIEILTRYKLWQQKPTSFRSRRLLAIPPILLVVSLLLSPVSIHLTTMHKTTILRTIQAINETTTKSLPVYSETLTGKTMEPINFIYLGSRGQIQHQFLSHGWYKADPSTVSNTLKALAVGFQGRQYLNAPVTPSYLASQPETLAFQQPTQSNTLRQRHHTRLWRTNFRLPDGSEVWVATASYDEGIEFSGSAKIPTHHIDPNVDAERDYITRSLQLDVMQYLQVVKAQAGKNAGGDIFFTDGRAVVTKLSS